MRMRSKITAVLFVPSPLAALNIGKGTLEVQCDAGTSSEVTFRIADSDTARRTYAIGRELEIEVTPR